LKAEIVAVILVLALTIWGGIPLSLGQGISPSVVGSVYRPVNVSFTTYGILLSYRHNDSATLLAWLQPNGTIKPFQPSFAGSQEVYMAESNGSADFNAGDIFLCSSDSIFRIVGGSSPAHLFAKPSPGSTVEYVAFDQTGAWGHSLLALTGDGGVWEVNASGSPKIVTRLGANLMPEGITVAPDGFGSFGHDLLVTMENNHKVVAIRQNSTATPTVLATFPNQAPERVIVAVSGENLLLAKYDLNSIVRFPSASLAKFSGHPLVITEGENGQTGAIYALNATDSHVAASTLLSDPTSPHFEGATFVPSGYLAISTRSSTTVSTSSTTSSYFATAAVQSTLLAVYLVEGAVAAGALLSIVIFFRRSRRALEYLG
jgi:hypothetical protein